MIRGNTQFQKYGESYVHSKIKKYMKGYSKFFIINEQECEIKPKLALNRVPKDFMTVSVRDKKSPNGKKYDVTNKMVLDKYSEEEQKDNFCPIDLNKRYKNYIMLNAGQTLGYHIKHNPKIIKNKLKIIIKHLLIGIRKLQKLHIIHRDIKLDNILGTLNKSKQKITFKYIDYGLADKIINLKEKKNKGERYVLFNGTKFYKPIDIFILKKMIDYHQSGHNIKDFNNFRKIINETKNTEDFKKSNKNAKNIKLSRGFLNLESSNLSLNYNSDIFINDEDLIEIYKSFTNSILNDNIFNDYTKVYSGIVYKADIYALGILFKQITHNLNINNKLLNNLIKNMLQLNPYKRFNVNQCLKHSYFK
jgi:serine/threonine protein kinase